MKTIFIASDHAGFELKNYLIEHLNKNNLKSEFQCIDLGPLTSESVDYPDFADKACQKINNNEDVAILICGSGQGMAMRANKYSHIRAALVWNEEITKLSREHNNANVLCLGSRFINSEMALRLAILFLTTTFTGGRHEQRVQKLGAATTELKQ